MVHSGEAGRVLAARAATLSAAYLSHPQRFVNKAPTPASLPAGVWINAPQKAPEGTGAALGRALAAAPESSRDDSGEEAYPGLAQVANALIEVDHGPGA